jgi:hypothetical protein
MDVIDDDIGNHVQPIVNESLQANEKYVFWLGLVLSTIYQSYLVALGRIGTDHRASAPSRTPPLARALAKATCE